VSREKALPTWHNELAAVRRFTRGNGIAKGFRTAAAAA